MAESQLLDLIYVFVFLMVGVCTALGPFVLSNLVNPRSVLKTTLDPYECGMDIFGDARDIRFHVSYYLYALIFVAFAVDILFLFPVAAAYHLVSGAHGIIVLFIFVFVLSLTVVYPWAKGVFTWPKRKKIS
ncbi:NADH dehydrogenase subunit A [Geoalkalibacter ferrihydriticus]|uniref:NADH-quinone oxidoreductase subunit n=2 Tax=Geoalkalibacter ferrihydriticus TaxID=392333 RepID=A0A0C2HGN1_9BACT|nr:NADH-quinone oxidoreductase subunit A [Geoalkalibacter ferrihydriticus]KIH76106.1 NADH dehydrogenase [Geoalkalibacter ferrihydriticus DSM 17813]SDM45317.1 NADH dehydrogenase subunit A [Geoalkalibacter ferrihydriticus]